MKVGDKVVCIDDSPCKCGYPECILICPCVKDSVYVIEHMIISDGHLKLKLIGIEATDVDNIHADAGVWAAFRFRPLEWIKEQAKNRQDQRI